MTAEIDPIQHPNFIWTWKESARGQRQSIWLPYLQEVRKKPKSSKWVLAFNGGEIETDLAHVDFIMLYGASGDLPVEFLDALNAHRICLSIHRRNMPRPYLFIPASGADDDDILTLQTSARSNSNTSAYMARTLIREKFIADEFLIPVSSADYKRLSVLRNVDQIRNIEAQHASRFWTTFYEKIGMPGASRRDSDCPINHTLDACSFFLQGILLRWVLFHRLSPFHGFLHRPTDYPSLVFDLIEPYRYWIARSVIEAVSAVGVDAEEAVLTETAISLLKKGMEEIVYVPATRQEVRRKSLLHGSVLALRAWLLDKQTRIVFPVEGQKKGGRPPQVGFQIPGYPRKN